MIKRMDLGAVSAYALAVEKGYTGTEEEFVEILTNALNYAEQAQGSASAAAGSAEAAGNYKAQAEAVLGNVNLAGAQQIEAIEATGTQQANAAKEAIEAKGKETLDSIPDSYEALQEDVTQLRGDLDDLGEFVGVEIPIIEATEGKYWNISSEATNASFSHSQIIKLNKNDKIVFKCATEVTRSSNSPALVSFISENTTKPSASLPYLDGIRDYAEYEYTATDEVEYVAFNWRTEFGYEVKIYRYQWKDLNMLKDGYGILDNFTNISVGYISSSNGRVTGTSRQHTDLFTLFYGESIEINAVGYTNASVSVLYEYDSDGTALRSIYSPKDGETKFYYTETKPVGYYKASSYDEKLKVTKYIYPKFIREVVAKTKGYEREYLKYLFENAIFIGDSLTKGILGTTGSTNNKISYPYYIGKMTGWGITNAGHGGYTTIQFWENDLKTLDFSDKDVCFIYLGQNGGFTDTLTDDTTITDGQSYEDYAATNTGCYCKIIEYIKEQNPDIHIFMLAGGGTNAMIVLPQIAEKYNLPCLDIYRNQYFYIGNTKAYHPYKADGISRDGVHFGKIGYLTLARSVLNMTFDYILEHITDFEYPYPN